MTIKGVMMKKITSPRERIPKIISILKKTYPDAKCQLNFKTPFELLIGVILSAQCTDQKVNEITPGLFKKYKNAKGFATAKTPELEKDIRPTGFYKNKTKSIQNCCRALVSQYKGELPEDLDELVKLPGVGRKSANAIRVHAFGKPGIVVDTHMLRVSERLGFTKGKDAEKVEKSLNELVPKAKWSAFSNTINIHGRRVCTAKKPQCPTCPIRHLCPTGQIAS
jgi:endonuclease-3